MTSPIINLSALEPLSLPHKIPDFRNTYIARQDKELTDINTAREGLKHWVKGLYKIYFAHH